MTNIQAPSPIGKSQDTPGERDLLLSALRVAAARAKLEVNLFETIGISLRQKAINCAQTLQWLKNENVLDLVQFGPEGAR